jgi:alkylhydroperoxidase family enzyme
MSVMIRRLILRKLDAEERKLGVSVEYLRHIVRVSLRAFFKLLRVIPLATYRRRLPLDALHVARLAAVRAADCGTCLQITANLAKQDGVPLEILRAAVAGNPGALPPQMAEVFRFAEAVARASGAEEELRELNPGGRILVWSDMFDPHHNARDGYYLVRGTLAGAWEGLEKDVIAACWHYEKRAESLQWFAERGHRMLLAGYYDAAPAQVRGWLEAARPYPGVLGVLYTTWQGRYEDLEEFARIVRGVSGTGGR